MIVLPAVTKLAIPKTARSIAIQNWTWSSGMWILSWRVNGAIGRMAAKRNWSVKIAKVTTKAMNAVDERNEDKLKETILSSVGLRSTEWWL
jgi:hypothetical protein